MAAVLWQYWGMVDYLCIGAYLAAHCNTYLVRFTLNSLPKSARDMLAYFYTIHDLDRLAVAFICKKKCLVKLATDQDWLLGIYTLFKQYADVCTTGGVRFCSFNVDPAFNHCVDVDLRYLKPKSAPAISAIRG